MTHRADEAAGAAGRPAAAGPGVVAGGPGPERPAVGALWRGYGLVAVAFRYLILVGWAAAAVAAVAFLPGISPVSGLGSLVSSAAPAMRAEYDATRRFGLPLVSQAAAVQRDAGGLSRMAQLRAARAAAVFDRHQARPIPGLAGAVPITNAGGLFPASRERSTTVITYLFFRPGTSTTGQAAGAAAFAHRYLSAPSDHLVGVTGAAPAQAEQGTIILRYLPWVDVATLLAIGFIVALYFRSLGAPLATLLCAAVAYLIATRVVGWAAHRFGLAVAPDLEPVLVVLLLGVTTDYSVFFLAGMRNRLRAGESRLTAARRTTAEFTPIILTAGLVVALGIGSLSVAPLGPLRAFGPALALAVLTAMVVAVTLAPALIAVFGRLLFHLRPAPGHPPDGGRQAVSPAARDWRQSAARLATSRPVALLVAAACVAGLLVAALGLHQLRLGFPLIKALPGGSEPVRAEAAAAKGFAPGILSPTEVLLTAAGVGTRQPALTRLQYELAQQPGVAGVVGPADLPALQGPLHVTVARSGDAARYGVIWQTDPLGAAAIDRVRALRLNLPTLIKAAGLAGVRFEIGGETALASEAIDTTEAGLWRITVAMALVILILLTVFLRSLIAPFYLLAASVLALLSALGITVWIFQGLLGYGSLVYYVPFAVAVLLVSLGSDYNVFVVGRIWEEARRILRREAVAAASADGGRPGGSARSALQDAVAVAVPRASRAITTAGLALAAGFGVLALVPLQQFRELAVAMIIGITLDTFIVRSLLVPALVVLFGRAGRWPAGRRARAPAATS